MPKKQYSMNQRISYNQGLAKVGGEKGARAKGFLEGVKAQRKATELARQRAMQKAEAEKGGKK